MNRQEAVARLLEIDRKIGDTSHMPTVEKLIREKRNLMSEHDISYSDLTNAMVTIKKVRLGNEKGMLPAHY